MANCHGIVTTADAHIILLTDETKNHFIIYDQAGKLLHKWGTTYPGAHGLSLVREGGKELLYFTDTKLGKVIKATPSGEILNEWPWPEASGKYATPAEYKPSWTLHPPESAGGGFYVLDGYGKDFIHHYGAGGNCAAPSAERPAASRTGAPTAACGMPRPHHRQGRGAAVGMARMKRKQAASSSL